MTRQATTSSPRAHPGTHPRSGSTSCRRDDPAHLPLAVHELEAVVDDPVRSRRCFRVGLEPARDRVRMRNATPDLIAEPGDCGLDLGRFGAASSETHSKPQRLQFADERVTQRRQDPAEEHVSSRFELRIVHLETTVGAPDSDDAGSKNAVYRPSAGTSGVGRFLQGHRQRCRLPAARADSIARSRLTDGLVSAAHPPPRERMRSISGAGAGFWLW